MKVKIYFRDGSDVIPDEEFNHIEEANQLVAKVARSCNFITINGTVSLPALDVIRIESVTK